MDENTRDRRREPVHRILVALLLALLAVFAAWCAALLYRTERLHRGLDVHFGWIEELGTVRGELERMREGTAQDTGTERLAAFLRSTEELSAPEDDPQLEVAVQNLRRALGELPAAGERRSGGGDQADDVLWQAAVAALAAVEALEGHAADHIAEMHLGLRERRRALYLLVFLSLGLAASNLGLLLLAHRRRRAVEEAHARALEVASHDPLTGLWNREGILRLLGHELVRAQRADGELGVILADVDHFVRINEAWGQDQGDYVLQQVSQRLQSLVRPYDTTGRYGGDSFLVVLPSCGETETGQVTERLRQSFSDRDLEHAFGHIRVSLSFARLTVKEPAEASIDGLLLELHEQLDRARAPKSAPVTS